MSDSTCTPVPGLSLGLCGYLLQRYAPAGLRTVRGEAACGGVEGAAFFKHQRALAQLLRVQSSLELHHLRLHVAGKLRASRVPSTAREAGASFFLPSPPDSPSRGCAKLCIVRTGRNTKILCANAMHRTRSAPVKDVVSRRVAPPR